MLTAAALSTARPGAGGQAMFTSVKTACANGDELGYSLFRWVDPLQERVDVIMAIYDVRDGGFLGVLPRRARVDFFLNYGYCEVNCVMSQYVSWGACRPSRYPPAWKSIWRT